MLYRYIVHTQFLRHCQLVIIQMRNLYFHDLHLNAAQRIYGVDQSAETDCHIIRNIQIQIRIQHTDRLFRTTLRIRCIAFIISIIAQIQECIPENRDQFNFLRILIDTCYDNTVAPGTSSQLPVSGIHTEQGNITIPLRDFLLLFFLMRLFYFFIDDDLFSVNIFMLYLIRSRHHYIHDGN